MMLIFSAFGCRPRCLHRGPDFAPLDVAKAVTHSDGGLGLWNPRKIKTPECMLMNLEMPEEYQGIPIN